MMNSYLANLAINARRLRGVLSRTTVTNTQLLWRLEYQWVHAVANRFFFPGYTELSRRLGIEESFVPSLSFINHSLEKETGFHLIPAAGFTDSRDFFSAIADGTFPCNLTQRDMGDFLFCDQPDYLHEVFGHAIPLANPLIASLYRRFGELASGASSAELRRVENLFWWVFETGFAMYQGERRAIGAAIISSPIELIYANRANAVPLSTSTASEQAYSYTEPQSTYFVVDDLDRLERELTR